MENEVSNLFIQFEEGFFFATKIPSMFVQGTGSPLEHYLDYYFFMFIVGYI